MAEEVTILAALDRIENKLARIDALLSEFEPVIRAYLQPDAAGPLAWAIRKKVRPQHGGNVQ